MKFSIPSSSLHFDVMFLIRSKKNKIKKIKNVLTCKDLSGDEIFIFSVKAQLPATTHPRHEHTHMLATDQSRTVSTASFQYLKHTDFWWRAPNYLA